MRKRGVIAKRVAAGLLAVAIAGCTPIYRNHGYAPSDAELQEIVVGVDTQATVGDVVGPPAASGVMRDEAWYYVSSRWRTRGALAPEILDRQLVAVSFDKDGVVRNIERFTLEDGRVIALNRRVTDDNIKGITFIRQLLGNIGNFTADQFID
ncbi:outer membrane protein assembly factor BamE [Actibacterium sp. MT2.3-13A]|uniref:outer membrane protein assembly factor BamE n=1 Tax=Actibacterium sp. MT2.3-13A TaxID=2828332 RepID=UPI001BA5D567|nr:outer membrane protein assembly factor BamE [Actibacterium sp. MT2.3-13A]